MKTQIMPLIAAALILASCTENNTADRQKSVADLERFVDSVETEIAAGASHDWAEIERDYKRLESNANDAWKDAADEETNNIDQLEARYAQAKADAEQKSNELNAEARKHLGNLENWLDRAADNTETGVKNAGEEVEKGVEESIDWFEKNYDRLEDNTKKEFDEFKTKWSQRS